MKKFEIKPLARRTNCIQVDAKPPIFLAASIISPVLIYYYLNVVIIVIAAMIISGESDLNEGANSIIMHNNSLEIAMVIKIMALVLAVLPLIPSFIKEQPVIGIKNTMGVVYTALLGVVLPLFTNVVFYKLGITGADQQYAQVQSNQFSLPIWGGVLLYGIITPICEEIVNRGLVYNRIRKHANVAVAVILSSMIFGISHGNVAQLLYAFLLGCIIALVYEKQGSFLCPVIFHGVANSVVYVAMSIEMIRNLIVVTPVYIGCGIISIMIFVMMFKQKPEGQIY